MSDFYEYPDEFRQYEGSEEEALGLEEARVVKGVVGSLVFLGFATAVTLAFSLNSDGAPEPTGLDISASTIDSTSTQNSTTIDTSSNGTYLDSSGNILPFENSSTAVLKPVFNDITQEATFLVGSTNISEPIEIPIYVPEAGIVGDCRGYRMHVPDERLDTPELRQSYIKDHVNDSVSYSANSDRTFPITLAERNLFIDLDLDGYENFWLETSNQLARENPAFEWIVRGFDTVQQYYYFPSCDLKSER